MKPGSWVRWRCGDAVLTGQCVERRGEGWAVRVVASVGAVQVLSEATAVLPESVLEESTPVLVRPRAEAVLTGSFSDTRERVRLAVKQWIEQVSGIDSYVYVVDIGPDWVIYCGYSDDLTMVPYSLDGDTVTLGAPVPVMKVTTYVTADATEAVTESTERIFGRLLAAGGETADGGRIFRVRVIEYGTSKNGRHYSEAVLSAAVGLYEGAKAYDHHRTAEEFATSTVQGLIGHYRNVVATTEGLEADLCLLPSASHVAELLDQSLANQADGLVPLVGLSHDVMATAKTSTIGGRKVSETTSIVKVNSADIVADPAAGGRVERMVAGGTDPTIPQPTPTTGGNTTMDMKELMASLRAAKGAERVKLLGEHHAVIEAAGMSAVGVLREVESSPIDPTAPIVPAPVPSHASEAMTFATTSAHGRMIIAHALTEAKLEGLIPMITEQLGGQFTEAQLQASIDVARKLAEGFELAGLKPTVEDAKVTADETDKKIKRLDGFFAQEADGYRSFRQAYLDFTGYNPRTFDEDLTRRIMHESLGAGFDSAVHQKEALDSTSWAQVLGDSITRRTVAEYARPQLQSWRKVVKIGPPIADFRTQRITRWGGYGVLPAVLEGAPYQALTSPGDEEATYAVAKKGGLETITFEMVKNDDVRSISAIPAKLGRAAATTIYRHVWDQFCVSVPTCTYDSVALFASGHSNTTSTALSTTALAATLLAMSLQAGYGDTTDILEIDPKFIVVTPALEQLAWQICTSAVAIPSGAPVGAASDIPNFFQGIEPIVVPYWNATSTTAWYVVADPEMCPTFEVGFLDGKQDPELFSQSDPNNGSAFSADVITLKVRHIYGSTVVDHRGLSRGNS